MLAFVALTLVCDRTERQLRESRRRLRHLADLDALTQVPNRRHFNELAQQALMHDPPGSAVLLLSPVDDDQTRDQAKLVGADDIVVKPVSGKLLRSRVNQLVEARRGRSLSPL